MNRYLNQEQVDALNKLLRFRPWGGLRCPFCGHWNVFSKVKPKECCHFVMEIRDGFTKARVVKGK